MRLRHHVVRQGSARKDLKSSADTRGAMKAGSMQTLIQRSWNAVTNTRRMERRMKRGLSRWQGGCATAKPEELSASRWADVRVDELDQRK
mmetsp:Transcript_12659/g.22551  ORF Transcript_12659/g.22551 Transcript_12659/m.22551 type:complete len:90 (+) Transcript_12659:201-470(+)